MDFIDCFKDDQRQLTYLRECNQRLAEVVPDQQKERIRHCRDYMRFRVLPNGKRVADMVNSCGNRLCPWCASAKSRSERQILSDSLAYIAKSDYFESYEFFKVELTWKNVPWDDLRDSFKNKGRRFHALCATLKCDGAFRCSEFTIGKSDPFTFHPHFHCLFAFKKGRFDVVSLFDLITKLWAKYTDEDIENVVKCTCVQSFDLTDKSLGDFAKYILKLGDLYNRDIVPDALFPACCSAALEGTKGLNSIGYSGLFAKAKKEVTKYNNAELTDLRMFFDSVEPSFFEDMRRICILYNPDLVPVLDTVEKIQDSTIYDDPSITEVERNFDIDYVFSSFMYTSYKCLIPSLPDAPFKIFHKLRLSQFSSFFYDSDTEKYTSKYVFSLYRNLSLTDCSLNFLLYSCSDHYYCFTYDTYFLLLYLFRDNSLISSFLQNLTYDSRYRAFKNNNSVEFSEIYNLIYDFSNYLEV